MKIPALNLSAIAVIPARYASTRFPGKPLAHINGISMLQRVYEQTLEATSLSAILIATDDERIASHAKSFGANVALTDPSHPSGTDRIAEAIHNLYKNPKIRTDRLNKFNLQTEKTGKVNYDVIVNVQGDEPFIDPAQIDNLVQCFYDKKVQIATMVKRITNIQEFQNPNVVKAVLASNGNALYFSRNAIPYIRNGNIEQAITNYPMYKHIGMYAYRDGVLTELTRLQPSDLELVESLEQLRWLQNGYTIRAIETTLETIAIDTPEDIVKAEAYLRV